MRHYYIFATLIIAAMSLSCSKINTEHIMNESNSAPESIVCYTQPLSKTQLGTESSGAYPIVWSASDAIMVYSNDGSTHSEYVLSSVSESGEGTFTSKTNVPGNNRTAVYPSEAFLGLVSDGSLRIDMGGLAHQTYCATLADGFDNVAELPLWAVEDTEENGVFHFNSMCGCLVLQLNDYQGLGLNISSVELNSASKPLTGIATVNPTDGSISIDNSTVHEGIEVVNETGVKISGSTPSLGSSVECFMIALPAGTYPANDLTFTITDTRGRVFKKTVSSSVTIAPGAVKKMAKLQFTLFYGTANCVIGEPLSDISINAEPYYSFDPLYAYENNRVLSAGGGNYVVENAQASVLWELPAGAGAFTEGSVISSCEYNDGSIKVTAGGNKGNALVALKDDAGQILWSFHVWVTDTPEDLPYTNINGGVFMDRNLGATSLERCNKTTPALDMLGLYYQHGRKDPFACSLASWNTTLSESEAVSSENGNIAFTIRNPNIRLIKTAAKNNWENYGDCLSFWGASKNLGTTNAAIISNCESEDDSPKTVYDPCPAGYKVPEAKYLNFNLKDKTKAVLSATGCDFIYDGSNSSYWPANGYMCQDSDVINTSGSRRGTVVCNWTTGANIGYSVRLFATSSAYTLTTNSSQGRAAAAGVRCRKITDSEGAPMGFNTQMEEPEDETL